MSKVRIVGIKHLAVHDGPGIRSTVFLKGCPLRCLWCHNPESVRPEPELALRQGKCVGCGACAAVCSCHHVAGNIHTIDRKNCVGCGRCVEVCLFDALTLYGQEMTIDAVTAEVLRDRIFYAESGGGVTVSGGEPLLHPEFCAELFDRLHAENISCAVDTCGEVPWKSFETVLPHTGLFLYDLKAMDSDLHRRLTGRGNERILANLRTLDETGVPVEIRMPVVPGLNDSPEEFAAAGRFLSGLRHLTGVRLLAYHSFARSKYESVGHEVTLPDVPSPSPEHRRKLADILIGFGVNVLEK